jgi:SAM-dependent methyltransferase
MVRAWRSAPGPFEGGSFDRVVFAASIQYFPAIERALDRALALLAADGEIHILDSPLYTTGLEREQAVERSGRYFRSIGAEAMSGHYHHHTLSSLTRADLRISIHRPGRMAPWIRRMGWPAPAFPYIVLRRRSERQLPG